MELKKSGNRFELLGEEYNHKKIKRDYILLGKGLDGGDEEVILGYPLTKKGAETLKDIAKGQGFYDLVVKKMGALSIKS